MTQTPLPAMPPCTEQGVRYFVCMHPLWQQPLQTHTAAEAVSAARETAQRDTSKVFIIRESFARWRYTQDQFDALLAQAARPLTDSLKAAPATPPGELLRRFREYLTVHPGIELGGHDMDNMALDLTRIALTALAPNQQEA